MINELEEGSSVLEMLDHDFEKKFKGSPVRILTCYESSPTPTVKKASDGSFKRDGDPVIMVTRARALLGYEDTKIGVYSDHSHIAKIDLGNSGPYLFIKQAIDRAILDNNEQLGSCDASAAPPVEDDETKIGLTPGRHRLLKNTEIDKDSMTALRRESSLCYPSPGGVPKLLNPSPFP